MRKLLWGLAIVLLALACVPLVLLATGTISTSSLRMILNVMAGVSGPPADVETLRSRYRVPPGFTLSLYARDIPGARFLRFTPAGDLLVSRPHESDILLLRGDRDGDGRPDGRETLLDGLRRPHGLDIGDGWLYVAESNRIGRAAFDASDSSLAGPYRPLVEGFSDNGNHWSKTLRLGPDGMLYLSQGSTCNVCEEQDPRRATMMRFGADGSDGEIFATGLRNSVGFDWAPWNGELYATDNGRDLLGDNFPPCELNHVVRGGFYGWPYFNGDNVPDPDMGPDPLAGERPPLPPVHGFRPHNAPLGITFVDAGGLPEEFGRSALVALHGSWNRSEPDGYKVVSLHWTDSGIEERDFLWGFNRDGDISGRPVDVVQGPDGAFYISDDYAGAIYRVSYGEDTGVRDTPIAVRKKQDREQAEWLATADFSSLAEHGAALYRRHDCARCHEAGSNPKPLDGLAGRMDHAAVIEVLRAPPPPMPVYSLTETERRALAVFLLSVPDSGTSAVH